MVLFKASGKTHSRVVRQQIHAFAYSPAEVRRDEFVLLSKNREDCASTEAQIQFVAKLGEVRAATAEELDRYFPRRCSKSLGRVGAAILVAPSRSPV